MQRLIEQLEAVRWRARATLVAMRLATWLSAVLGAAIVLGLVDYILRLPGWLRLVVVLALAAAAIGWAVAKIGRALRVDVALTTVAQRLERLYPEAAGKLASAVAFSSQAEEGPAEQHDSGFRHAARQEAANLLEAEEIRRLLDSSGAWRQFVILAVVILVTVGFAVATPASASLAAQRWLNPLGDASWPNRYAVQSLTEQDVAPNHVPLRLSAQVTKGDRPDLRTWAGYQFLDNADEAPSGRAWQRALMTRQEREGDESADGGEYERLIEVPSGAKAIAFYFEAGDDQTQVQVVELVQPPTLTEAVAEIQPPPYAEDYVMTQREYLLRPPRPSVTIEALAGSRVALTLDVEGSFDPPASDASDERIAEWAWQTLRGLIADDTDIDALDLAYDVPGRGDGRTQLQVAWTLRETAAFQFDLADAHGSRYEDQRRFRFEARPDREPNASILEPGSDQQVLATAEVDLAAEGHDDVAVRRMALQAGIGEDGERTTLAREQETQPRVSLAAVLDLAEMEVSEGDEVAVVAVAEDNFELDGERHEAVESSIRWLRIISEQELRRQLQTELADVRERAIRARRSQQELREAEANRETRSQQEAMGERLEGMQRSVEELAERMQRNRLEAESLEQTLEQAGRLTEAGAEHAADAENRLARAENAEGEEADEELAEARQAQDAAAEELGKLVQLLDQGRDAYEIQEQLTRLQREQEVAHDAVRELLPRTLGERLEDLADAERQELEEAGDQQEGLAEDAEELLERMRSTAAALAQHAERPEEQAVAEALREAAETADEQALQQQMEEAAEEVQENRLSQAQQQQEQARQVLREMMEQMGRVDEMRQEILSRQLMELVESIRELRDQQAAQLDRLVERGENVDGLDEPMLQLRRNTMAVAEDARQAGEDTLEVAALLEEGADQMADAVRVFRRDEPNVDRAEQAERSALRRLEEALELAEELSQQAQEDLSRQEREELVQAYREAMAQQQEVQQQTRQFGEAGDDERNRRWRADVREVGDQQAAVREVLEELSDELAETVVYRSMHDHMDRWAERATESLRGGEADASTVFDQEMIVSSIEGLIESLQSVDDEGDEFAEDDGGGGGGGGGGGAGGEGELIPDIAELRLLRSRQVLVHELTRQYGEDDAADSAMVEELSRQQSSLAEMGEQLIEQLQEQMQGGGGNQLPQPEPQPEGEDDAAEDDGPPALEPELQRRLEEERSDD